MWSVKSISSFNEVEKRNFYKALNSINTSLELPQVENMGQFFRNLSELKPIALIYILLICSYFPEYYILKVSSQNYIDWCYPFL